MEVLAPQGIASLVHDDRKVHPTSIREWKDEYHLAMCYACPAPIGCFYRHSGVREDTFEVDKI